MNVFEKIWNAICNYFIGLGDSLYLNFVKDDRYLYLTRGLAVTLEITFFALLIGVVLGFILAIIRSTCDKTGKLKILNMIAKLYITIIRGTPVVLQLLILYFVIFASVNINKVVVAAIAFGLNSGAYVAEIVRSGIMAVDEGQFEAAAVWDSIIFRQCATLSCRRQLRTFFRHSVTSLSCF